MSDLQPYSGQLREYIAAHTRGDDDFMRALKAASVDAGLPQIWIGPAQVSLVQLLLRLCGARQVVEVGTLGGLSAIAMARALPADGKDRTIEVSSKHAAFARQWVATSDVADRVEVLQGSGLDMLKKFGNDSADAIFIDADKANYLAYVEQGLRIVRRGGLLMADNAFAFGQLLDESVTDPDVVRIREFNDAMARDTRMHAIMLAQGDGMWAAVRL